MTGPFRSTFDLSHTLFPDTPTWDGGCGFQLEKTLDYAECQGPVQFKLQSVTANAGIGTHIDAPAHCFPGGATIDELPLSALVAPCVILRADRPTAEDLVIGVADLARYEERYGRIAEGAFVIASTGWSVHWKNPSAYRNELNFPSVSSDLASTLLERGVSGLGIDTLSADRGGGDFPVHRIILGAGRYLVENIATTPDLPENGATAVIAPTKIGKGTEAPIRLFLLR